MMLSDPMILSSKQRWLVEQAELSLEIVIKNTRVLIRIAETLRQQKKIVFSKSARIKRKLLHHALNTFNAYI